MSPSGSRPIKPCRFRSPILSRLILKHPLFKVDDGRKESSHVENLLQVHMVDELLSKTYQQSFRFTPLFFAAASLLSCSVMDARRPAVSLHSSLGSRWGVLGDRKSRDGGRPHSRRDSIVPGRHRTAPWREGPMTTGSCVRQAVQHPGLGACVSAVAEIHGETANRFRRWR